MFASLVLVVSWVGQSAYANGLIPKEFSDRIPIGRTFRGVKVPNYDKNTSLLATVMEAESITRVDANRLDIVNLTIRTYDAEGGVASTIFMAEAEFHLIERKLRSKTPAEVDHTQMNMTGDVLSYDMTTEIVTMEGNVRVVIPDAGSQFSFTVPE